MEVLEMTIVYISFLLAILTVYIIYQRVKTGVWEIVEKRTKQEQFDIFGKKSRWYILSHQDEFSPKICKQAALDIIRAMKSAALQSYNLDDGITLDYVILHAIIGGLKKAIDANFYSTILRDHKKHFRTIAKNEPLYVLANMDVFPVFIVLATFHQSNIKRTIFLSNFFKMLSSF